MLQQGGNQRALALYFAQQVLKRRLSLAMVINSLSQVNGGLQTINQREGSRAHEFDWLEITAHRPRQDRLRRRLVINLNNFFRFNNFEWLLRSFQDCPGRQDGVDS